MDRRFDEASLEEYVSGTVTEARRREIEAWLAADPAARAEVDAMRAISALFAELRPPEDAEAPAPGFTARVFARIEAEQPEPSLWSMLFAPEWARRIAFASLLLLATLGSYLLTRESEFANGPTPEMIMAMDNESSSSPDAARDRVLVALVSFE